jgi:hypothetical protein
MRNHDDEWVPAGQAVLTRWERRSDMLAEHPHKGFWERFRAWFAWRNG